MRAQLHKLWESRSPRERMVAAVLAAVLGAALCLWLTQSAYRARAHLRTSVATLRAQAASLEQQAAEIESLRAKPAPPGSQTDLHAQVRAQAGAAGLSRALTRLDAPDSDHVKVSFGAVAFADWLAWVAGLQTQFVRLEDCRVEALSTPGLVSVTATFVRAK